MITTRQTKTGARYVVRYRLGGRAYTLVHGGSFRTLKEARARRDLVAGELANGRNPADLLHAMCTNGAPVRTFAQVAVAYKTSRVDIGDATRRTIAAHLKTMGSLAECDPATITPADVQEWLGGLKLKPSSVRPYITTLRAVLDFAGVDPNPARDARVRLPRQEQTIVDPPSAAEVETIFATVPKRFRLPLRVLEQTGMRVGELEALAWGDVDEDGDRFRVREGKTVSARRWVAVPTWLMLEVAATVAREDRTAERRVLPRLQPRRGQSGDGAACRDAGIVHRHPHDLRHRYASLKIAEGVPVTTLAAQLGHSKKSLTLDVYSHVMPPDEVGATSCCPYSPRGGEMASDRKTYLTIYHDADGWLLRIRDGGPCDGARREIGSDDDLIEHLGRYLFKREGAVVIERLQSDLIDAEREAFEAQRERSGLADLDDWPTTASHPLESL